MSVSPSLIDVMQVACKLWESARRSDIAELLGATGAGKDPAFWAVARALGEILPEDSRERRMVLGLAGNQDALTRAADRVSVPLEELTLFDGT